MNASEQILQYVQHATQEAKRAEAVYDSAAEYIEFKSSSTISLNSGNAVSKVAEIASLSRNACEELYSSYQSLVRYLDEKCRPLIAEGADTHSVKELLELIKWLNSESNIGTNFSASLNGTDYGDMFNVQYSPTMENRMIQKYWETTYSSMPGTAEEDKAYSKKKEEERLAKIEARKKQLELERQRQQEERERARIEEENIELKRISDEEALNQKLAQLRPLYVAADRIITAGSYLLTHSAMVIREDETIFTVTNSDRKAPTWKNAVQIITNGELTLGLLSDGSVQVSGDASAHRMIRATMFSNIKKIAMGEQYIVGLGNDGKVQITGESLNGHPNSTVKGPMYWDDIDDIYCGSHTVIGKRKDGSLTAVEYNYYGRSDEARISKEWDGCIDLDVTNAGNEGAIALLSNGKASVWGKMSSPKKINQKAGIVKVKAINNRAVAIYHDGTVVMDGMDKTDRIANGFNKFIEDNKLNGRVLAVNGNGDVAVILTTDGQLYIYNFNMFGKLQTGKVKMDTPVLTNWKKTLDRFINVAKYERERQEREERIAAERRAKGVCQYCGGEFKKVFLGYKCVACDRRKDY